MGQRAFSNCINITFKMVSRGNCCNIIIWLKFNFYQLNIIQIEYLTICMYVLVLPLHFYQYQFHIWNVTAFFIESFTQFIHRNLFIFQFIFDFQFSMEKASVNAKVCSISLNNRKYFVEMFYSNKIP